jgi:outer membrane protein OmpA-like peptidoglycan-associated protein
MKKLKITLITLVLFCCLSQNVLGQLNRLQYADKQFELANYRLAADEYSKIYLVKQEYAVARQVSASLNQIYAYSESYEWWKKVVSYSDATKADYASLIKAGLRSKENYDPTEDLQDSPYELGDFDEFSIPEINQVPHRVYDLQPIAGLNSSSSEYSLSSTLSGIQFFASNRGDGSKPLKSRIRLDAKGSKFKKDYYKSDGKKYYGIYLSDTNGKVMPIQLDGYELYHLSDPQLVSNGKIFFTATPNQQKKRDQVIYPGLFYGSYDASTKSVKDIVAFPFNATQSFGIISPRVDESQKRLYFSSNQSGGKGGYDLYYVIWDDAMNFSEPVNLGEEINSSANERDGYRSENEFYFSSDRIGGFGGLDVYQSTIEGDNFRKVSNLGQPINSVADDFGFLKISTNEAYLASDRVGGLGFDDLYTVKWSDRNLKIFVVDQSGNSLKEGANLQLITSDKRVDISELAENELLNLTKKGNTYSFTASKTGYFNQNVTATLTEDQEEITLVLVPVPYEVEVSQEIIYYDFNKDFLRELSKEKLDEIIAYMIKYPELNFVIESHTDSRATDKYNQKLSEQRAKSVTNYLEEKGVFGDRVKSVWFNESRLVNDCGDGVLCSASKHQMNRRSELKLIIFPNRNQSYDIPVGAALSDFQSKESVRKWYQKK